MKRLLEKAGDYGFEDAEVRFDSDKSMNVEILHGEVSSFENSTEQGLSFRGKIGSQLGCSSTTVFDEDSMDYLLEQARENALILDDEDEDFIYCDPDHSKLTSIQLSGNSYKNDYKRFSELGLEIEHDILAADKRIKDVDYLSLSCSEGPFIMMNSKGLDMYKDSDSVTIVASLRGEDQDDVKTTDYFWFGNDIDKFDKKEFVDTIVKRIVGKFGAKSVRSGTYDIILGNEALISLISTFFTVFSSYSMLKGMSLLAGKEGKKIASDVLTFKEVPMYKEALIKVPFDTEGVITQEKAIINKGVFETALYNLKSANKAGKKSTGNGYKGSISASNLVVEPGKKSFDELCETIGNGLYITELSGLHSGVNEISGDFSLLCEGYLIKDGKLDHPVEQITVADNFFSVLRKISEVGSDVISYPEFKGEMFCPSVIIKDISVSGEE